MVLPVGKNHTLIRLPSAATFPCRALGAGEGFWVRAGLGWWGMVCWAQGMTYAQGPRGSPRIGLWRPRRTPGASSVMLCLPPSSEGKAGERRAAARVRAAGGRPYDGEGRVCEERVPLIRPFGAPSPEGKV